MDTGNHGRHAGQRRRGRRGPSTRRATGLLAPISLAIALAVAVVAPGRAAAVELLSGTVDATGSTGPAWTSTIYTPSTTGSVTFSLDWTGTGDLAMDVRRQSDSSWVAAEVSTNHPKSLTTNLDAGVGYRIAVWARSGTGAFTLDATAGEPVGGTVLDEGTADATGVLGPRWRSIPYTAPSTGTYRFDLGWTGTGDLDLDVRSSGTWIADDVSAAHPKALTVELTGGTTYAIAVWASSGVGTYTLAVTEPEPPGLDCSFTRSGSTATLHWVDEGGTHVVRRNDAWLATPGAGVDTYVDTASPAGSTYTIRTWLGGTSTDRPCVEVGASALVVQRGTVSASGDPIVARNHTFVASTTGPVTAQLDWTGTANLDLQVVRVSDGQTVASSATSGRPESATFPTTVGTSYRITSRAVSGTADMALTLAGHRVFPAAPTGAPNILLINVDDARPEALEVMPAVRSWFGDQGTSFTNFTVSTPACCPSRAATMTGQYDHNNGQVSQDTPGTDEQDSIQRHLIDHGYLTAHSGKYLHYYDQSERPPSWDRWNYFKGGYFDVVVNRDGQVLQSEGYSTIMAFDRAIEFAEDFDAFDDGRPWFLEVTPIAPHYPSLAEDQYVDAPVPPWDPPPSVGEVDRSDKPPWVNWINQSEADAEAERARMHRTMMTVDDQVDALMTRLDELGELDDTIAVFTSDNGFFWGEHNLREKFLPYDEAVDVPLLIRWPGHATSGAVDDRNVANIDLLPTFLAAAGLTPDHVVDGRDIFDPTFDRQVVLNEYWFDTANGNGVPDWTSISTDTYLYVEYVDDDDAIVFREYYDRVADPYLLVNLLQDGNPGNDPDTAPLSALLDQYGSCAGATCP